MKKGDKLLEPNTPVSNDTQSPFLGWKIEGEESKFDFTKPTAFKQDATVKPTNKETVRINAIFKNSRKVVFIDENGAIVRVKEIQKGNRTHADDIPMFSPRDSYLFSHWSKQKNGNTAFDFKNESISDDTVLYAVSVNQKTISFDSKGGTPVNSLYITNGTIKQANNNQDLPKPLRPGYDFSGWIYSKTTSKCF